MSLVFGYRKILEGPLSSAAMDGNGRILSISNNIFYMTDLHSKTSYQWNMAGKELRDVVSDSTGNIYLATEDTIEYLKFNQFVTETLLVDRRIVSIKYLTIDISDRVYLLADLGDGDKAYMLNNHEVQQVPAGHIIKGPFAVDADNNTFFDKYNVDGYLKCMMAGLRNEKINGIAVDHMDNVYYATDSGLFMSEPDTYLVYRVTEVDIPNISRVFFTRGEVYFVSSDEQMGGVYQLRRLRRRSSLDDENQDIFL